MTQVSAWKGGLHVDDTSECSEGRVTRKWTLEANVFLVYLPSVFIALAIMFNLIKSRILGCGDALLYIYFILFIYQSMYDNSMVLALTTHFAHIYAFKPTGLRRVNVVTVPISGVLFRSKFFGWMLMYSCLHYSPM